MAEIQVKRMSEAIRITTLILPSRSPDENIQSSHTQVENYTEVMGPFDLPGLF